MLKAWSGNVSARYGIHMILVLIVILGFASADMASPVAPWLLGGGTLSSGTAAVGIEPNTAAAASNWGPAITFTLPNNSSFTNVAYTPGTTGSPPPYLSAATNSTTVGQYYPGGSNLQPSAGTNYTQNVSGVGPLVAVAVTAIATSAGTIYTDPYTGGGTPLGVSSTSNSNLAGFNPGADVAILAGNFVSTSSGTSGTISLQVRSRSQNEMAKNTSTFNDLPPKAAYLASEAVQLSGQKAGYDYVLQMDFSDLIEHPIDQVPDIQNGNLYLGALVGAGNNSATWENAVYKNVASADGAPAVGSYAWQPNDGLTPGSPWVSGTAASTTPFVGSFEDFSRFHVLRFNRNQALLLREHSRAVARHLGRRPHHRYDVGRRG